ncbi:MAG: hypothetical protein ACERKD_10900 [Prolixibacteraceae bacterium]
MRAFIIAILLFVLFSAKVPIHAIAQDETTHNWVMVVKDNGIKFIGEILTQDAREILLKTEDLGEIYIPRYVIKEIKPLLSNDKKHAISEDIFATRYFITTNGLPIKKGENYIQWNIYGPDFQFGIADNFGIGVMTSWAAIPIIANAKYSIDLGKNKSMALGLLAGTGSWALPKFGVLLPFVSFTMGDRVNNLTFSGGYGSLFYGANEDRLMGDSYETFQQQKHEGRVLLSVAGMAKISEKFSLVFDTFISPWGPEQTHTEYEYYNEITGEYYEQGKLVTTTSPSPNLALIIPGIRWQLDADRVFQFGFTGMYFDGQFQEFAIPMIQLYRRL